MRRLSDVFEQADQFFMGQSNLHRAADRLAKALRDLEIPFAVAEAMAVNAHGHQRTTADLSVVLTPEGLAKLKAHWLGRGWLEHFEGSKGLRDTEHDVRIDVLLSGQYPGDGKPKPVVVPSPDDVELALTDDGWPVLVLPRLIELKLASGMTAPHRPRDLDDVIQLIRINALPSDYAKSLDPYVGAKFLELWEASKLADEDF